MTITMDFLGSLKIEEPSKNEKKTFTEMAAVRVTEIGSWTLGVFIFPASPKSPKSRQICGNGGNFCECPFLLVVGRIDRHARHSVKHV